MRPASRVRVLASHVWIASLVALPLQGVRAPSSPGGRFAVGDDVRIVIENEGERGTDQFHDDRVGTVGRLGIVVEYDGSENQPYLIDLGAGWRAWYQDRWLSEHSSGTQGTPAAQEARTERQGEQEGSGMWVRSGSTFARKQCKTDFILASAIGNFLLRQHALTVMDLGCGCGNYLRILHAMGIRGRGFDSNPFAPALSSNLCLVADITQPLPVEDGPSDWTIVLEVAEHIPDILEASFLQNVVSNSRSGVIISWAGRGQYGLGHVNPRDPEEVVPIFEGVGFQYDEGSSSMLRASAGIESALGPCCGVFRENLMVFRRSHEPPAPGQLLSVLPGQLMTLTEKACETDRDKSGFGCLVCTFERISEQEAVVVTEALWEVSPLAPLSAVERLCCADVFRCVGFEVDSETGVRRLISSEHMPHSMPADGGEAFHPEAGIYVRVT